MAKDIREIINAATEKQADFFEDKKSFPEEVRHFVDDKLNELIDGYISEEQDKEITSKLNEIRSALMEGIVGVAVTEHEEGSSSIATRSFMDGKRTTVLVIHMGMLRKLENSDDSEAARKTLKATLLIASDEYRKLSKAGKYTPYRDTNLDKGTI